jgi:hypothetical protein
VLRLLLDYPDDTVLAVPLGSPYFAGVFLRTAKGSR